MSAINANIVVETTTLTLSPSTTSIGVTVDPINLNVNTTDQGVPSKIANGTSNVDIATANGNITMSVDGTSNVAVIDATGVVVTGTTKSSGTVTAPAFTANTGLFTGDGGGLSNIAAGNVIGLDLSQISNGTSNVDIASVDGNVTVGVGGVANVATITTTGANIQSNLSLEGANGNITFTPDTTTVDGTTFSKVTQSNVAGGGSEAIIATDYTNFNFIGRTLYAQSTSGNISEGPGISFDLNSPIGNANTDSKVHSSVSLSAYGPNANLASTSVSTRSSLELGGQFGGFTNLIGSSLGTGFGQASWKQFQYQPGAMSFWRRNGNGEARQGVVSGDKTTIEFIMASNNGSGSTTWASYPSHIAGRVDSSFGGGAGSVVPTGLEYQVSASNLTRRYHYMDPEGRFTINESGVDVSGNPISTNPISMYANGTVQATLFSGDGGALSNIAAANVTGLSLSSISNETSNVTISAIGAAGGNIDLAVGGADVARFSTTGAAYPAVFTVQGNINAYNDITAEPGAKFIGDGGGLSNIAGSTSIANGSSNISIPVINNQLEFYVAGQNVAVVTTSAAAKPAEWDINGNITVETVTGNLGAFQNLTLASSNVRLGGGAGQNSQGSDSIAIGFNAGLQSQATFGVAVGNGAGQYNQLTEGVAIGHNAGQNDQGSFALGLGSSAGATDQGNRSVAIGFAAGFNNQGNDSVAIGHNAGEQNQGGSAVAIGSKAGSTSQHNGSIVINATGANLQSQGINTFTVKPVRNAGASGLPTGFVQMAYNPTTGEIVYYT